MTTTERAVRKASRERLLREMGQAARLLKSTACWPDCATHTPKWAHGFILGACEHANLVQRACLMTAFGQ